MTYQLALAPEKATDFATETEKRAGEMLDRLPKIEQVASRDEKAMLADVKTALLAYFDQIRAMVKTAQDGGDAAGLKAALGKALDAQKAVTAAVKIYSKSSGESLATARADALSEADLAIWVQIGVAAFCVIIGGSVSSYIARNGISRPIKALNGAMSRLAGGDLSGEVDSTARQDEIGEMAAPMESSARNSIAMRQLEAQEQAMHAKSAELQNTISGVVAAAVNGDFSLRISKDYDNPDLNRFASSVNELVGTVDKGVGRDAPRDRRARRRRSHPDHAGRIPRRLRRTAEQRQRDHVTLASTIETHPPFRLDDQRQHPRTERRRQRPLPPHRTAGSLTGRSSRRARRDHRHRAQHLAARP